MVYGKNFSLQYVNFMNWMVRLLFRLFGELVLYGNLLMHKISNLNLAL